MAVDDAVFLGYALLVLGAPLVPPELLICFTFLAGTHGLAGDNAGWAGAATAAAIGISVASRMNLGPQRPGALVNAESRLGPLQQPMGFLVVGALALLLLSCIWSPVRDVGMHKFADLTFRSVVPIAAIIVLERTNLFGARRTLRALWVTCAAIAGTSLALALARGIAFAGGARLRFVGLHPLALAEISAVGCLLVLSRRELGVRPFRAYLAGAVCLATLILTGSKGPLLALGIAVLIVIISDCRNRQHSALVLRDLKRVAGAVGLVVVLALGAGVPLLRFIPARLTLSFYVDPGGAARSQSISARELLWTEAFNRGLHQPLTGRGLGASSQSAVQDQFSGGQLAVYPHNLLLEVFAEAGVAAVILIVAATAVIIFRTRDMPLALGLLGFACVTATVTGGLADHRVLILVVVAIALPVARRSEAEHPASMEATATAGEAMTTTPGSLPERISELPWCQLASRTLPAAELRPEIHVHPAR